MTYPKIWPLCEICGHEAENHNTRKDVMSGAAVRYCGPLKGPTGCTCPGYKATGTPPDDSWKLTPNEVSTIADDVQSRLPEGYKVCIIVADPKGNAVCGSGIEPVELASMVHSFLRQLTTNFGLELKEKGVDN